MIHIEWSSVRQHRVICFLYDLFVLQFGETENEGPFDLAFSTGTVSCFHSTASLQEFLTALDGDEDCTRDWALRMPNKYVL